MGSPENFENFVTAVIHKGAFERLANAIEQVKIDSEAEIVAGGGYDDSKGYFVEPTVVIKIPNAAGYATTAGDGLSELQTILGADATTSELAARGQQRTDYNMRVGQSKVRGGRFFANFKLPLDDNGTELYSFAGMSSRNGNSAGFYRLPSQSRTFTPAYRNYFTRN